MSAPPSFEFVDAVTSDLSFVAWGESLEAAFASAAEALLAATVGERTRLSGSSRRTLALEEPDLELLLLRFLNELVYLRDAEALLLLPESLEIDPGPPATLRASLVGEAISDPGGELEADVKAVTAYGLEVRREDERWTVRATLDV